MMILNSEFRISYLVSRILFPPLSLYETVGQYTNKTDIMHNLVRKRKTFGFLHVLATRRMRNLVATGGVVRGINRALWTKVDENVIKEAGNQSSAE